MRNEPIQGQTRGTTGPKTLTHSPLRHRLISRDAVVLHPDSGESLAEFDAMLADLVGDVQPAGLLEEIMTERIAVSYWRLGRAQRFETAAIRRNYLECYPDDADDPPTPAIPIETLAANLESARKNLASQSSHLRVLRSAPYQQFDHKVVFAVYRPALERLAADNGLPPYNPPTDAPKQAPGAAPAAAQQATSANQARPAPARPSAAKGPSSDHTTSGTDPAAAARHEFLDHFRTAGLIGWEKFFKPLIQIQKTIVAEAQSTLVTCEAAVESAKRRANRPQFPQALSAGLLSEKDSARLLRYEAMVDRQFRSAVTELHRLQAQRTKDGKRPNPQPVTPPVPNRPTAPAQQSSTPSAWPQPAMGKSPRPDAPNEPTAIPRQHVTPKAQNEPMGSGQAPTDNGPASRHQPPAPNEPNYRQPLSTAESNTRTAPAPNEPTPASHADAIEPAMDRGTGSDQRLPEYMRGPVRACYAGNLKDDIKHQ